MIKAIITDIEGTTTDIHFVHQVLFPYSKERMHNYIETHQDDPNVSQVLNEVRAQMGNENATIDEVIAQLIQWIDEDKKIGSLKTIQGQIWRKGYQDGNYKSHIYMDAFEHLTKWHQSNIPLYVYSSGSVQAQQLLFQYTPFGDLRPLFAGYFDTQVGGKKEAASYENIAKQISYQPNEILFLSDVVQELDAARQSGFQTVLINRNHQPMEANNHPVCFSFSEIEKISR